MSTRFISKTPVPKSYNNDDSDLDENGVRNLHRIEENYRARGNHFKLSTQSLAHFKSSFPSQNIIAKKLPVYGFMDFALKSKEKKQVGIKINQNLHSTKIKGIGLDIQENKTYMSTQEVKNMVRVFNSRKRKEQLLKLAKLGFIKLSLRIFRSYLAQRVLERIKQIFMEAALLGYLKFQNIKKRKEVLTEIKQKNGVSNFIKKIFAAKAKQMGVITEETSIKQQERKGRGFIGKLKKIHVIKKKVLGRRKQRFETVKALPSLTKSPTVFAPSPNNMKVVRGKFAEASLRMRIEKKLDIEKAKRENRENPIKEKAKSPSPRRYIIHALDPSVQEHNL